MSNQSGRDQAIAYRKSQIGGNASAPKAPKLPARAQRKAAPAATAAVESASSSKRRPNVVATAQPTVAAGRKAAQERRTKMVSGGRAVSNQTNQKPVNRREKAKPTETIPTRAESGAKPAPIRQEVKTSDSKGRNGRNKVKQQTNNVVQSGGRARSVAYRKALVQGKATEQAFRSQGGTSGSVAKATNPGASTRDIARKVRAEKCSKGACGTKPSSNSRKGRQRPAAPEKVGKSETLSGQSISGTQVGVDKLTGAESGSCATVSGTEYLGTEQFAGCATAPEAAAAKVTQTQTTRGQIVSGNRIGNGSGMTGHEAGACSSVTGTEYIPADQSAVLCGTNAPAATNNARTFSVEATVNNSKITGGENYVSNSTIIRPKTDRAPLTNQKVIASSTSLGNATTGTQVGRVNDIATGSETGQCSAVTGTEYVGVDIAEAMCSKKPNPAPAKVSMSGTTGGQTITGDRSGMFTGFTGAEAGSCQAVTGDQYVGSNEQGAVCGDNQRKMNEMRKPIISQNVAKPISGSSQPGIDGLTGAQKGACSVVSGTPYVGADQTTICSSANAAQAGESDFPIMMDGSIPASQPQAQRFDVDAQDQLEVEAPQSRITGDGWDRGSKVTGTEGQWANSRNTSVKGSSSRQAPMGAAQFRPNSMEAVPLSPITGSSGNADTGAKVTLSGGARA